MNTNRPVPNPSVLSFADDLSDDPSSIFQSKMGPDPSLFRKRGKKGSPGDYSVSTGVPPSAASSGSDMARVSSVSSQPEPKETKSQSQVVLPARPKVPDQTTIATKVEANEVNDLRWKTLIRLSVGQGKEVGGWIYWRLPGEYSFVQSQLGATQAGIDLTPQVRSGWCLVATIHTHPNEGEYSGQMRGGYLQGPSPEDRESAQKWSLPGIIITAEEKVISYGPNEADPRWFG